MPPIDRLIRLPASALPVSAFLVSVVPPARFVPAEIAASPSLGRLPHRLTALLPVGFGVRRVLERARP